MNKINTRIILNQKTPNFRKILNNKKLIIKEKLGKF